MDPLIGGSLILGGAGLLGGLGGALMNGLFGVGGTEEAMDTAEDIARANREWMEKMSNTAHQREVKDLRKAGLNPILSATGGSGASTPSADTSFQPQVPKWDWGDLGVGNMIRGIQTAAQLEKLNSDIALNNAAVQQSQTASQLNMANAEAKNIDSSLKMATKQFSIDKARIGVAQAEKNYQKTVSDLAVKEKQNAWRLSPAGHSAFVNAEETKALGKFGKDAIGTINNLYNFGADKVIPYLRDVFR